MGERPQHVHAVEAEHRDECDAVVERDRAGGEPAPAQAAAPLGGDATDEAEREQGEDDLVDVGHAAECARSRWRSRVIRTTARSYVVIPAKAGISGDRTPRDPGL